jgi:DNA modification methylase
MTHTTQKIIQGDVLEMIKTLSDASIDCCVTSPPYYGLRDYGHAGQIGLEQTPEEYVAKLVAVFHEVRRVLKTEGTLWLNLGDSYNGSTGTGGINGNLGARGNQTQKSNAGFFINRAKDRTTKRWGGGQNKVIGLKPKDLIGIPWMVAFALRTDGWFLRQDIIWAKPNPMPESVTDRCTKSHEYVFLMAKSQKYFYDAEAIKERRRIVEEIPTKIADTEEIKMQRNADVRKTGNKEGYKESHTTGTRTGGNLSAAYKGVNWDVEGVNKRSVWNVPTHPYNEAHFAVFPEKLIEPMVIAGCPKGGTVLDPFSGAATTGVVCKKMNRNYIGIELNPKYVEISERRLNGTTPALF